jgi:NAD(P)-dependent dehydrogenase (short-subunit alcohol dehydrogenase family)
LPLLKRSKGAVVNNLSTSALAALPIIPGYSISKAAMLSMTQSLRALLAGQGVTVHAILTGPVDTDMTRSVDFAKASPESVAVAIFDGVQRGEEEIFPDPMSQSIAEGWLKRRSQGPRTPGCGFRPGERGSLTEPPIEADRGRNLRPESHEGRKDDDDANDSKSRNEG